MTAENPLGAARRALRAARSEAEIRRAIDIWGPRFHELVGRRVAGGRRPDLGIETAVMPGPAGAAIASKVRGSFLVSVTAESRPAERRFALAHEVAHVLLHSVDQAAVPLDGQREENLCDLFARRAVAPPAKVRAYLARAGPPAGLDELERFARSFRLSWRSALVALDEFFPQRWPVAFVAASWRGHPDRPAVKGMRIDASSADRRVFLPAHCRLGTLKLTELERWAQTGTVGTERDGCDEASLRSRVAGTSGWAGKVAWNARLQFAPRSKAEAGVHGVVCQLDVGELRPVRKRRRRRRVIASGTGALPEIPGQLHLARS